jgi:plastocyanin
MNWRMGYQPPVAVLALVLLAASASAQTGQVRGSIELTGTSAHIADLGPTAVFLDPADADELPPVASTALEIVQQNAEFRPSFLVIRAGRTVTMPNRDVFLHNVFSYSRPNDFDLGIYPTGESRSVTLRDPGVVRVYCSIHESMRAVILVAPSPWFAIVDAQGEFRITDVPPGRYSVRSFNEALPEIAQTVNVAPGQIARARLRVEVQ